MRPGLSWIIVGAVVAVGVFAGLDALRSSDEAPLASGEREQAVTTAPSPQPSFTLEGLEEPPSEPAVGEPVLNLQGELAIYDDGRVIWPIEDGDPGYLQMRLTPEGVEALRSRAASTGFFEPTTWRLPRRMYVQRQASPFVPSRLVVVYDLGEPDWSTLPPPAREVVSANLQTLIADGCQVISTDQAGEMARALTQAGIHGGYDRQRGLFGFDGAGSFVHSWPALPHEVAC
jgi:hypothetical protein